MKDATGINYTVYHLENFVSFLDNDILAYRYLFHINEATG